MRRFFWVLLLLCPGTLVAQTATLSIDSPQAGASVTAGATIDWTITVDVSSGDNEGLALVLVDLLQDVTNLERVDLLPGSVPVAMTDFSRPAGISNPGPGGAGTGYGGTSTGVVGERDLLQIGGGQNTFGVAGSGIGTEVNVTSGVGQAASVIFAQGSFVAPSLPGVYRYHLVSPLVNVLTVVGTAPGHSTVVKATTTLGAGTLEFEVDGPPEFERGECNADGSFNVADAVHLLAYLFTGPVTLACEDACDTNDDGALDLGDAINLLSTLFDGTGPLPDPSGVCGPDPTNDALPCDNFTPCN